MMFDSWDMERRSRGVKRERDNLFPHQGRQRAIDLNATKQAKGGNIPLFALMVTFLTLTSISPRSASTYFLLPILYAVRSSRVVDEREVAGRDRFVD